MSKQKRWVLSACALVLILLGLQAVSVSETKPKTVTGYFKDHVYMRPSMTQTLDYVDVFPPYTIVTLEIVDDTWAVYTSPNNKTGYVKYDRILPVPEYEKETPYSVYAEKRVQVRSLPVYEAPIVYTAADYELLTVDGRTGGYLHVIPEDGSDGYVLQDWVKKAEFTPDPISPVRICTAESAALLDMPLRGAHSVGVLRPDTIYTADGQKGNYYALTADGTPGYVEKTKVAVLSAGGNDSRNFFRLLRIRGQQRTDRVENIYASALIREEGAALRLPGGKTLDLPGNTRVYLYAGYGEWYGAVYEQRTGYLRKDEAVILTEEIMQARLREMDLSGGGIQQNEFLDQAFTMVEPGNPFQARYRLLTGSETKSLFPMGVPYFWGGRSVEIMTERLPDYTTREAWQSSPVYYQKGTIYLYGLDCIGFVKAVYELAGKEIAGSVTGHRAAEFCEAGQHVYCDNVHPLPEDWTEAARRMQIGDLMVIHHPGTHAMIYMGTLRDYGYTEEQLPALAKYLDYPLMFQSGENPYSYLRFQSLIEHSGDRRTAAASPPDGGVSVCILGVPREDAELVFSLHDTTSYGFDVEGCCVTIMSFGNVKDYFVWRIDAEQEISADAAESGEDETEAAGDDQPREEMMEDGLPETDPMGESQPQEEGNPPETDPEEPESLPEEASGQPGGETAGTVPEETEKPEQN